MPPDRPLGAAFFLFAFDLTGKRNAALGPWGIFSLTAPVFFYSGLIYPEVPAALISELMNARLVVLLANHIGDLHVLKEAVELARSGVEAGT